MHLYNAWLPLPVAEETKKEKESFSRVVSSLKDLYRPDDPDSVYSTLKWISVIDLIGKDQTGTYRHALTPVLLYIQYMAKCFFCLFSFIKAKSDICLEDVVSVVEIGLELFHKSQSKLYAQVRWGNILVRLLNKYRRKLSLKVQWRPFYDTLIHTHFTRNTGPEGWRLRQRHFETVTSLVRSCRRFFPAGSASEIWSEFRQVL
ncbi:hypothetical protein CRYUN_Cryun25bG0001500 [Craigia yunnanensis]